MKALISLIFILISPLNAWAQNDTAIEIKDFFVSSYTDRFTRGLQVNLRLQMKSEGKKLPSTVVLSQDTGAATRRFDREWIGVVQQGYMLIADEKTPLSVLNLFDPTTLRLIHTIDMNDLSITSYEWIDIPKTMRLGETKTVGRVREQSSEDKPIAQGIVQFKLSKIKSGYEFCTIEKTIELDSKDRNIVRDCDLFDANKKIIGSRLVMNLGKSLKSSGRGEIIIN